LTVKIIAVIHEKVDIGIVVSSYSTHCRSFQRWQERTSKTLCQWVTYIILEWRSSNGSRKEM